MGQSAKDHVAVIAFDVKKGPAIEFTLPGGVVLAKPAHVRREQSVKAQLFAETLVRNFDTRRHEKDRRVRIRHDILDNAIPARGVGIGEAVVQRAFFRIFEFVFEIAAFLMAKGLAVSDEKLEIAGVRTINIRIIDFVDDAVAESEPDTAS